MSKPAFIVDGFTEKLILGRICPGSPVSRTDLNGKSVTLDAIANKLTSLIRLFNNRNYPIIIDREQRTENCGKIALELKSKLEENGIIDQDLRICIADRMFENWIIADWEILNTSTNKPEKTDGLKGVSILKKELGSYNKVTDGVNLFLKSNLNNVYNNSESFKNLIDIIKDVECEYSKNLN